jgi:hypothetical protein
MRRAAVLLLITASCDPQADSAYQGEPLVTLRGYVSSSSGPTPLEAAMLWQRGPPPSTNDVDLATRAPVQAGFPATFTVHLYQPPPAAARRTLAAGEIAFARANAAAVPYGVAAAGVAALPAASNASYGIDPYHWVVYLAADVPPHSLMEWWLGAALHAGFYLMRVAAMNPSCVTPAQLEVCVADLGQRGVKDRATAVSFCLEPYKLSLAPPGEQIVLDLGTVGIGPAGGGCP